MTSLDSWIRAVLMVAISLPAVVLHPDMIRSGGAALYAGKVLPLVALTAVLVMIAGCLACGRELVPVASCSKAVRTCVLAMLVVWAAFLTGFNFQWINAIGAIMTTMAGVSLLVAVLDVCAVLITKEDSLVSAITNYSWPPLPATICKSWRIKWTLRPVFITGCFAQSTSADRLIQVHVQAWFLALALPFLFLGLTWFLSTLVAAALAVLVAAVFARKHEVGHAYGLNNCAGGHTWCVQAEETLVGCEDFSLIGKLKLLPHQVFRGWGRWCPACREALRTGVMPKEG